jgi:anti-anti-sigma regulatory factor
MNSPLMRHIAEAYIASGGKLVVIDLETCSGVDSTFMGTIAGIARRLSNSEEEGEVQIASPTDNARSALECLGLDALVDIEPAEAPWRGHLDEIRSQLSFCSSDEVPLQGLEQTMHILESHQTLRSMNEDNDAKFKAVTECLTEELNRQKGES